MNKYVNISLPLTGSQRGNATMLWHRVANLSKCEHGCIQSDSKFAYEFNVNIRTIQRWIKHLIDAGDLYTNGKKNGFRKLSIVTIGGVSPLGTSDRPTVSCHGSDIVKSCVVPVKSVRPSICSGLEGTALNETEPKIVELVRMHRSEEVEFIPPVIEEVRAFFDRERLDKSSPDKFFRYYDKTEWRTAKGKPIKDWYVAARGWNSRQNKKFKSNTLSIKHKNYEQNETNNVEGNKRNGKQYETYGL